MIVSVVIPAYNEERRIEQTLKSILSFSFWSSVELELIVVDDASRDQTASVVKSLTGYYPCIKLLRGKTNRGKGFSVPESTHPTSS